MQEAGFQDRRTSGRTPVISSCYFFCLRKCNYGVAQIQDMSVQGIGLVTEEELAPAFPLEMWMSLPRQNEYFHVYGDVAWTREIEPRKYRVGLKLRSGIPQETFQALLHQP